MSDRPPRVARWLVGLVTEASDRQWLVGDLDEWYVAKRDALGARRADVWYWRQVLRSISPLVVRRLQPGKPSPRFPMANTPSPREPRSESFGSAAYYLRHAFRRLTREPAFTVAAIVTLALGVGGNVAVFAVVEAVMLRPLPYPSADRLVIVNHRDERTGITKEFVAVGDYVDLLARQQSFDAVGAYSSYFATVYGSAEPYRASTFSATPAVLAALGVRPTLGRAFEPNDARQGGPPTVMLGYEYWRDKYGSDPHVLGQSIRIGQTVGTIVGVGPPQFKFRAVKPAELIFPLAMPAQAPAGRKNSWTFMIGRLKPRVTLDDAQADLARVSHQLEQEFPQSNRGSQYFGTSLRDVLVGNTKTPLVLLLAAVGVVLLIACANVANLLLARSLGRRREMAVRLALGAGRRTLALQLLSESFVLAFVAAALGIVIAFWGERALVALVPRSVEAPGLADVRINGAVLGFAMLLTIVTTLVFGLTALLTVRVDSAAGALVAAGRTSVSAAMRRMTSSLVVVEVALAIVLLVGAGLIMRTFSRLLSVDPGFKYDHVMTMTIALPSDRYRDSLARQGFYAQAYPALRAVPGVQAVGDAAVIPLTGNNWTVGFERTDQPVAVGERPPEVGWQAASGGFFKALGIPLIAGRVFDERDRPGGPPVVVISEAIQKRFFPNESPVGRRIKMGDRTPEIVGVVGNVRRAGLRDDPRADLYFSAEQSPSTQTTLFVRTAGDPGAALSALQNAIRSVEAKTTFIESHSLGDIAAESVRATKLLLWLLGVFAGVAVVLAAIGIYGVMSYVVRQRTREIGTRIALGATGRGILWLIMRQGAVIAVLGTAIGLSVGIAATRSLDSMLFGVSAGDPATMAASTLVLVGAVLAACYVPARRAAAVDPVETLAEQ